MVRLVKVYNEIAADFKAVAIQSPQDQSRQVPLHTSSGPESTDPCYQWRRTSLSTKKRIVGTEKAWKGRRKSYRYIRFSTGHVCKTADLTPLGSYTPQGKKSSRSEDHATPSMDVSSGIPSVLANNSEDRDNSTPIRNNTTTVQNVSTTPGSRRKRKKIKWMR
eukprot:1106097-Ditylum_brightwellii.AAC.1